MKLRYIKHSLILILLLLSDQLSKLIIDQHLTVGQEIPLIDNFLSIVHIRNRGAAWGFLADKTLGIIFLSSISCVASIFFIYLYTKAKNDRSSLLVIMLLAGTLGNLIDRIRLGEVVDFIAFQFGSYHYPAFNVADSLIVISVLLFVYLLIRYKSPEELFDLKGVTDVEVN